MKGDPPPAVDPAPRSRRSAATWNLALAYAAMALALSRSILLVPIYLRFISLAEWGAWAATGAVVAGLAVTGFGVLSVITQRCAAAYGARDRLRLGDLAGTSLVLSFGLAALAGLLLAALAPMAPRVMGLEGEAGSQLAGGFLVVALTAGVSLAGHAAGAVLKSLQRPIWPGVVEILSELGAISTSLILIFRGWGIYAIAIGIAVKAGIGLTANLIGCLPTCWRLGLRLRWSGSLARELLGLSRLQFLTWLAVRVQLSADLFFIGYLLGPELAGLYALTVKAPETIHQVNSQFGSALIPSMAHLHGDGALPRYVQVTVKLGVLLAFIGAVGMGGAIALNEAFVGLWVGAENYAGPLITVLYAVYVLLAIVGDAPHVAVLARGGFARLCVVLWATTAFRLPLLIGLVQLGLWGAPVAAIVASVFRAVLLVRLLRSELRFERGDLPRYLFGLARVVAPPMALAAALTWWGPGIVGLAAFLTTSVVFVAVTVLVTAALNAGLVRSLWSELRGAAAVG